jgi:hypothetical protein
LLCAFSILRCQFRTLFCPVLYVGSADLNRPFCAWCTFLSRIVGRGLGDSHGREKLSRQRAAAVCEGELGVFLLHEVDFNDSNTLLK